MADSCIAKMACEDLDDPFDVRRELNRAKELYRNHEIPPDVLAGMAQETVDLFHADVARGIPGEGEHAPSFNLPLASGGHLSLAELRRSGPVVLTFYLGRWCPYCDLALRALRQIVPELGQLGASLVAISPQPPDDSLPMVAGNGLSLEVLSDQGLTVAEAYGLAFDIPDYLREIYERLGHLSPTSKRQHALLVPATFVVDRASLVRYRFFDPEHTRGVNPRQLVTVVRELVAGAAAA